LIGSTGTADNAVVHCFIVMLEERHATGRWSRRLDLDLE
jgi:hypothetical protein